MQGASAGPPKSVDNAPGGACLLRGSEAKLGMSDEHIESLSRPQRRLLRRIYNGRTIPIVTDGQPFLTYKAARQYLLALTPEAREAAYLDMKEQGQ